MLQENKINNLLVISILFSLLGFFYYFFFRENTIGLSFVGLNNLYHYHDINNYLNSFPSFIHVVILSLLTWYVLEIKQPIVSIGLWVGINLVFEFLQKISNTIEFLANFLTNYFVKGTFDWFDVVAIFAGAFFSYYIIQYVEKKKGYRDV